MDINFFKPLNFSSLFNVVASFFLLIFTLIPVLGYAITLYEGDNAALVGIVLDSRFGYQRYCESTVTTQNVSTSAPYMEYHCVAHINSSLVNPNTNQYSQITVSFGKPLMISTEGIALFKEIQNIDKNLIVLNNKYWNLIYTQPYMTDATIKYRYDNDPTYKAQYDAWINGQVGLILNDMKAQLTQRVTLDDQLLKASKPVPKPPPPPPNDDDNDDTGILNVPF